MRKLAAIGICCLFLRPATPAGFVPYPVASEWTQILNHAQLVLQLGVQAQALSSSLQLLNLAKIQGRLLTAQQWARTVEDIARLSRNIRQGQGLAYTMSSLDRVFRTAYPGYLKNDVEFKVQYDDWNRTTQDTLAGVLRGLHIQGDQLTSDAQVIGTIQRFSSSAAGETQVLQAGVMTANMQVDQLAKLRQIMMMQLQTTLAVQAQDQHEKAALQSVRTNSFGPAKFQATN